MTNGFRGPFEVPRPATRGGYFMSDLSTEVDCRTPLKGAPDLCMVLDPAWGIVTLSDAYAAATMARNSDIEGRGVFEVFPNCPDDAGAAGVNDMLASFHQVSDMGRPGAMPVQKSDIRRPKEEGRGFEERFRSSRNTPIVDVNGQAHYTLRWCVPWEWGKGPCSALDLSVNGGRDECTVSMPSNSSRVVT